LFDLFFFFGEFEQEFGVYNQQEELPFSVFFFLKLLHDPASVACSGLAANAAAIEVGKQPLGLARLRARGYPSWL
jgi:hypothetical protein